MIDTAALREKVLDLAIRGKLVPQDPTDEPASVLLERIHEQKLQMVREGKLKAKDVKDDTIIFKGDDNCYYEKFSDGTIKNIQDEIPFDLPDGWSWCRLNSISSSIQYGLNKSAEQIGTHKLLRITDIQDGFVDWNNVPYTTIDEYDKYQLRVNDIVFARTGATVGKSYIIKEVPFPTVYASYLIRIRVFDSVCADYIYAFFNSGCYWGQITDKSIGVGQPNCNGTSLSQLFIPIPPIAEQLRVLDKAKESLTLVRSIEKSEKTINESKTLLKSKILELAIQGKLVPQDENDEPAGVLLERIRAERKAKLGKKYVESYIYKGDDNCYYEKVGSTVKNITDQIPFSIPQNWSFVRLKELAKVVSGVSYDKRDICNDGIRIIRGGNISNLSIVLLPDDVFLPQKYYDNEKEVKTEDIVIVASTGSKIAIGRPAFADKSFPQTQIGAFLRIVRPYVPNVYQYLKCPFASNYYREHISDLVHGNTINNIKTEYLDEFIIPFPPIREQKEIANKVKILMDILKGGD